MRIGISIAPTDVACVLSGGAQTLVCRSAIIGQSENVTGFLDNTSFWTSGAYPDVAAGVNVEIAIPSEYALNESAPTIVPVTPANAGTGGVSPGAVGLANLWHVGSNGAALRLAGVCKSGTGMPSMMDDDEPARNFDDDAATVAAAEAAWGPVERVLYQWYGSEAGASKTLWESRSAHFFGLNPDGTDYDFATGDLEHCLIDKRAVQTGGDKGLLGPDTVVDMGYPGQLVPTPAWRDTIDPPHINYTTDSSGDDYSAIESSASRLTQNASPAYRERRDFLADAPAENAGVATVSPALAVMGDYQNGAALPPPNETGAHPALQTKYGQILYSQDVGFALLCAHGFAQPTRLDRVEVEETGAYADFIFDLPVGARLRTHREVDGLTVASPRPHQQQVMGFVLRRSGDDERSQRPVYRTDLSDTGSDLTNYPLAYRGTVEIVGDGSAGVVRVTPEQAFGNADTIIFGGDGGYGQFNLHGSADYDAQLCLDGLRAYEPRLDDGSTYKYPGGPVVAQETHQVVLAGGNPAPVAGTVTRPDGDNIALRGPDVPAGTNSITLVYEGEVGVQGGFGAKQIVEVDNFVLQLLADTRASQRNAFIRLEDSNGSLLINRDSIGQNSLSPAGTTMRIMVTATQDDGTGNWRLGYYLNDALVGSEFTGATVGTGLFQTGFPFLVAAGNSPLQPGRVVIWAGSYADAFSEDGTFPTGTPFATLQGDAAYWNGTGLPAGWSTQGTGTWTDV